MPKFELASLGDYIKENDEKAITEAINNYIQVNELPDKIDIISIRFSFMEACDHANLHAIRELFRLRKWYQKNARVDLKEELNLFESYLYGMIDKDKSKVIIDALEQPGFSSPPKSKSSSSPNSNAEIQQSLSLAPKVSAKKVAKEVSAQGDVSAVSPKYTIDSLSHYIRAHDKEAITGAINNYVQVVDSPKYLDAIMVRLFCIEARERKNLHAIKEIFRLKKWMLEHNPLMVKKLEASFKELDSSDSKIASSPSSNAVIHQSLSLDPKSNAPVQANALMSVPPAYEEKGSQMSPESQLQCCLERLNYDLANLTRISSTFPHLAATVKEGVKQATSQFEPPENTNSHNKLSR